MLLFLVRPQSVTECKTALCFQLTITGILGDLGYLGDSAFRSFHSVKLALLHLSSLSEAINVDD